MANDTHSQIFHLKYLEDQPVSVHKVPDSFFVNTLYIIVCVGHKFSLPGKLLKIRVPGPAHRTIEPESRG